MDLRYNYWYFKSALTFKECKHIIDVGEKRIKEFHAHKYSTIGTTAGNQSKQEIQSTNKDAKPLADLTKQEVLKEETYIRDSEVCFFNYDWCYDLVMPYVHKANKEAGWNFDIEFAEDFQFTKYHPDGFYGWHVDGGGDMYSSYLPLDENTKKEKGRLYSPFSNWQGKCRKLSVTINLNSPDEYEGGKLKFDYGPHTNDERYHECDEIKPQGSIIVFPSFMYHQVTPVTRGTRYSLVLWALGNPFR